MACERRSLRCAHDVICPSFRTRFAQRLARDTLTSKRAAEPWQVAPPRQGRNNPLAQIDRQG